MFEKELTPPHLPGKGPTSDSIDEKLKAFQAIQYSPLRRILCWLPWVILLFMMGIIFIEKPFYPMYASMYLAASLGIFAFQFLMKLIPETLYSLWNGNIITAKSAGEELKSTYSQLNCIKKIIKIILRKNRNGEELSLLPEEQYRTFIQDFEKMLNSLGGQRAFGVIFVVILWVGGYSYKYGGLSNFVLSLGNLDMLTDIHLFLELLTSSVFGLMAWRMTIVGVGVIRLVESFDLTPRLGHPDGCGGLSPLGNLCLWNAIIIGIMGIFLAGWIIIVQIFPSAGQLYGNFYINLQSNLLILPIFFSLISFFLPLWFVHDIMVARRVEILQRLDILGKSIHQIESKILNKANNLEPWESKKMIKKLELMQQTYQRNLHYPTWPFDTKILEKFLLSIIGPVLALLGVGKTILDLQQFITAFLNPK